MVTATKLELCDGRNCGVRASRVQTALGVFHVCNENLRRMASLLPADVQNRLCDWECDYYDRHPKWPCPCHFNLGLLSKALIKQGW